MPGGKDHPFLQTMIAHFNKLQTPLRAVEKYPTTFAQRSRFRDLGWPSVSVCSLWKLWSHPKFVSSTDREYLDRVEPFDEWEEFALFGAHYFLLVADTNSESAESILEETDSSTMAANVDSNLSAHVSFVQYPKAQGCRRFAAAMQLTGSNRVEDDIGIFGGMGLMSRLNNYDLYSSKSTEDISSGSPMSAAIPSSRMCHTITDLGDNGTLLVGGRTSPDGALSDCWLHHKWLKVWERVDDLPYPLYRHQAINLSGGCVLVSTGRIDSCTVSADYLFWSRRTGWLKCAYGKGDVPPPTYGATFGHWSTKPHDLTAHFRFGILAGGMSSHSSMQQSSWRWDLLLPDEPHLQPVISFERLRNFDEHADISRFGASVVNHEGKIYVVGGIMKDNILNSFNEICAFELLGITGLCSGVPLIRSPGTPRPLLVGTTVLSSEESLVIMGGSAVCFSFGTFWNRGCFTLRPTPKHLLDSSPVEKPWRYIRTVEAEALQKNCKATSDAASTQSDIVAIPRIRMSSSEDFEKVVQSSSPVILEGLDIGSCTTTWTAGYLKKQIGTDREVSFLVKKSQSCAKKLGGRSSSYYRTHELQD